jgi:hypothetical protein
MRVSTKLRKLRRLQLKIENTLKQIASASMNVCKLMVAREATVLGMRTEECVCVHTSLIDSYLGGRIRDIREQQGLLLVDVAKALVVTPTELADYEAGRLRISASGLFMLTRALGVSVHEIYDGLADAVDGAANGDTQAVDR